MHAVKYKRTQKHRCI